MVKFRMRRRLQLKVLYWPAIASTSIIVLLLCVGPLDPWLRPVVDKFWAGGRVVDLKMRDQWPANNRLVESSPARRGNLLPQRSLFNRGFIGQEPQTNQPPLRGQTSWRDASWNAPSVADRAEWLDETTAAKRMVAAANLLAPEFPASEELAGLDLDQFAVQTNGRRWDGPVRPALVRSASRTSGDGVFQSAGSGTSRYVSDWDEQQGAADDSEDWYEYAGMDQSGAGSVHGYVGDEHQGTETENQRASRSRHGLGGGWPDMPQLIADLRQVDQISRQTPAGIFFTAYSPVTGETTDFQAWHADVNQQLATLRRLPSIASTDSTAILASLETLAKMGYEAAESITDRPTQIACLRAAHSLLRRVAIWNAVHRATISASAWAGDIEPTWADREAIQQMLVTISADVAETVDATRWRQFLLLSELEEANLSADEAARRLVAQRFLSRLDWYGLTQPQQAWIQRDSIAQLAAAVRRWAVSPVDYASLLGQLERQESDAIDLGGIDVARATQSLRFASSQDAEAVAHALNTYYRNANIRIAVSAGLIERMVPAVDSRIQPVRQRILGSDVRGHSLIDSQVAVRLIPSPTSWRLQLETMGNVQSQTSSRNGPVSIRNGSQAQFNSVTPLEITRLSASAAGTAVDVQSQTRLRGVETDFDSIPLVSTLVREIALNRYQSLAPIAKQIQNNQVRASVSAEVDKQVGHQIDEASQKFTRHLLGPLGSLGLNPMVVDMQTTDERLTARYRIGGDWQLGAFTPRPRAPSNSWLSIQMHQSVLNNTLETALPAGQSKSIQDLVNELSSRFAIPDNVAIAGNADDLPDDTVIHFAPTRPITVEIEDDLVWITLRIMRLHRPGSIDLRRFVVRAAYKAEVNGLSAQLVRDAHLRISGPDMSMRDRLPVRAIFNKVFSTHRPLPLLPPALADSPSMEGLAVNQLELRDGWIGLAIGPATGDRVAEAVADEASSVQ